MSGFMELAPTSSLMDFSKTVPKGPSFKEAKSLPKGVTPVWDEKTSSLKIIPDAQVQAFADAGFKVGVEAQTEALHNSGLAKVGAAATTISNTFSMGGFNAALAATGQKGSLKTEQAIQEANPYTTGAAAIGSEIALAGIGAYNPVVGSGAAGTTRLVGDALVGKTSKLATLAGLLPEAVSAASMGAVQAGTRGALDEFTREKVIGEPVSVEKITGSSLSEVMQNGMWGIIAGGAVGAVRKVRPATGNVLQKLEDIGILKKNMVKDAEAMAAEGPRVSRFTVSAEESELRQTQTKATETGSTLKETRTQAAENDSIERRVRTIDDDAVDKMTRTKTYGKETNSKNIFGYPKVGDAEKAKAAAEAAIEGEVAAGVGPSKTVRPDETDFHFEFHPDTPVDERQSFVRKIMRHRLEGDETAQQFWNEATALEAKMKDIEGLDRHNEQWLKLQREKAEYHAYLMENLPADVGPDGVARPSWKQLQREYARASGNRFVDQEASQVFGGAPAPPGAKAKMPKSRAPTPRIIGKKTVNSGEDVEEMLRNKSRDMSDTSEIRKTGTKTNDQTHAQDKTGFRIDDMEKNQSGRKAKASITYVMPKKPNLTKWDGTYKPLFGSQTIRDTGIGVGLINKGAGVATAGGMVTANALTYLAGRRKAIGAAYDKVIVPLARGGAIGVRALQREEHQRGRQKEAIEPVKLDDYNKVASFVNAASTNPDAISDYLTKTYPNVAIYHPEVLAHVTGVTVAAVNHMQQQVPKKPFDPTLQEVPFQPPRSQKVRMLRTWHALCNPEAALKSGDPQAIAAVREVYPNLHRQTSISLTHEIATHKGPITGRTARHLSRYLDAPVRPSNEAAALKRLQETGGMPPVEQKGAPKPSGGGSKVSQQAAMRDATDSQAASLLG